MSFAYSIGNAVDFSRARHRVELLNAQESEACCQHINGNKHETTMKKTLIALLALAFMGSLYANETYKVSDYVDGGVLWSESDGAVTLIVDKDVILTEVIVDDATSLTLTFCSDHTLQVIEEVYFTTRYCDINGDDEAVANWASALKSATDTSIIATLVEKGNHLALGTTSFMGVKKGGSITLGDISVEYVGCYNTLARAQSSITSENQIAIFCETPNLTNFNEDYDPPLRLLLVGKGGGNTLTPATPEPATGSLSLLALAGLCARRRRK